MDHVVRRSRRDTPLVWLRGEEKTPPFSHAARLVGSADIVKRFGAMTANTVMFGSSALLLCVASLGWGHLPTEDLSMPIVSSMLYIGVATASVFLLRYRALQTISPATVAVYQNLTPVCAILFACWYLGEPYQPNAMVGGAIILFGAELVRRANQSQLSASYLWAKRHFGSLIGNRMSA
jgi:drug/metabolite transporter (DMT)-like permease